MPLRENRAGPCCELHTRIRPALQLLVELVQRHGDEITECPVLQFGQSQLSQLVLDVKPVVVTVLRKAPVAQQSPYKDCLLPAIEIESISNFPRRYPVHSTILMAGCDRTFTDIAGLFHQPYG
jgi:hypothetical protein